MRSSSRLLRGLAGTGIVLLLSAAGVEMVSRVRDRIRHDPWDPEAARQRVEEDLEKLLSRSTLIRGGRQDEERERQFPNSPAIHPYVGWALLNARDQIAEDLDYYRTPKSREVFDVVVLGGSVANGFGLLGADPLIEALHRDPRFAGREIRVHNYAVWGYQQLQQMSLLAYLLELGHEPDAVIELDGLNEAAEGWINARTGTNPLYPSATYWANATFGLRPEWGIVDALVDLRTTQDRAAAFGRWLLATTFWRGSFLGHLGLGRFEGLRGRYASANTRYLDAIRDVRHDNGIRGPRFPADDEGLARTILRGWEESSISMHAMCAAQGIFYLHVLQPTLHDQGSKPLTEKEIKNGQPPDRNWIVGIAHLYDPMREAGKRLAARGIPFCDATGVFRGHTEDIYVDTCHFKEHGNELLAGVVAKSFLEALSK
jgi:hypothetical protein